LKALDFDLSLTGFNSREIDEFTLTPNAAEDEVPPVPQTPVSTLSDLWLCGPHRVLCGDATSAADVARLLDGRKPFLMITDPPYGIELDSEWRDRAGLNGHGPAEPSYMKKRTQGHTETSISGDTRADWSEAFELLPSLQIAYVWHASVYTTRCSMGCYVSVFCIHNRSSGTRAERCSRGRCTGLPTSPAGLSERRTRRGLDENSTVWDAPSPKFIMSASDEEKYDHPTQKPCSLMRRPTLNHTKRGELVYEPFLGSGTTLAAARAD
jgi:hypothetical protein